MGLPPRPPLSAAPPPAAPLRVSTGAVAAEPHARGRRPRPPGCGRDGGGCGGSGAAPPGRAFTRSPPQQVCSRRRGCGRSGRRKRRVRGRQGERPPPIAPRRGPCCRGPASAQHPQPRAGAGVSERRAAAAPYIAGGAAPPAPSNRCRSRAGCPPACPRRRSRRRLPWPSLRHPPAARRGGGVRAAPAPRTAPPPAPRPCPCRRREESELVPRPGGEQPLLFQPDEGCHGAGECRCSLVLLFPPYLPILSSDLLTVPATPWGWAMPGSPGSPAGLHPGVLPAATSLGGVTRAARCRSWPCGSGRGGQDRAGQGRSRSGPAPRDRPPCPPGEGLRSAASPAAAEVHPHRITSPALHF